MGVLVGSRYGIDNLPHKRAFPPVVGGKAAHHGRKSRLFEGLRLSKPPLLLGLTQLRRFASQRRVLPAAAWYFTIICLSFLRSQSAKNDKREQWKYRCAEGSERQLAKS